MVQKKCLRKTDQEWMDLIQECRSSGLTDTAWCEAHGLHRSTLYHHIRKLRNKACDIPRLTYNGKAYTRQEVVPVTFEEDHDLSQGYFPDPPAGKIAARVLVGSICVEIHNGACSDTIRDTLSALRALSCQATCPGCQKSTW